jgi:chloramphenicol 3-O phosphotransferase
MRTVIFFLMITGAFTLGFIIYKTYVKRNRMFGAVIILNGPSSVGKSSIIKAFQAQQKSPWLATGIDHLYVGVIPPHWLDDKPEHHAIMTIKTTEDQEGKTVHAVFGPEGRKVIKGMHRAIAAYAQAGNNVIVDYIKYEPEWLEDFQKALNGIKTMWVKVTAPLDTIIKREKERGTSPEGHARSHYHTVHENMPYNLTVNTDKLTPDESAQKISAALKNLH